MRAVYGTQGGGLARKVENTYIFVEVPDWASNLYQVGDEVPLEWGITGPFDQDNGMQQIIER